MEMTEFYRYYANKDSMLIYAPYISFRYSPPKITEYGNFGSKVMISVGRTIKSNIDKEKIAQLPKKTRDILIQKSTLESFQRPEITTKDKIMNTIIRSYINMDSKIKKALGIMATHDKERNVFEIYQFFKAQSIEELMPISHGYGRSIGVMARISKLSEDQLESVIREAQTNIRKAILQGHDMAKVEGWK